MLRNFIIAAFIATTAIAQAATQPTQVVVTAVQQPKGPVRAWQLLFDNRYSFYTAPVTIGFYKDLASCERVKAQTWTDIDGRQRGIYHRLICVEVDLP